MIVTSSLLSAFVLLAHGVMAFELAAIVVPAAVKRDATSGGWAAQTVSSAGGCPPNSILGGNGGCCPRSLIHMPTTVDPLCCPPSQFIIFASSLVWTFPRSHPVFFPLLTMLPVTQTWMRKHASVSSPRPLAALTAAGYCGIPLLRARRMVSFAARLDRLAM
jgi:hypothetical protein